VKIFVHSGQAVDASEATLSFHYIYAKETQKYGIRWGKKLVSKVYWQDIE